MLVELLLMRTARGDLAVLGFLAFGNHERGLLCPRKDRLGVEVRDDQRLHGANAADAGVKVVSTQY